MRAPFVLTAGGLFRALLPLLTWGKWLAQFRARAPVGAQSAAARTASSTDFNWAGSVSFSPAAVRT